MQKGLVYFEYSKAASQEKYLKLFHLSGTTYTQKIAEHFASMTAKQPNISKPNFSWVFILKGERYTFLNWALALPDVIEL